MSSKRIMGLPSCPCQDPWGGWEDSLGHMGRLEPLFLEFCQGLPAGAGQDEHRDGPDVYPEDDVLNLVADHVGTRQVDPELGRRSQGEAGSRLPAVALLAVPGIRGQGIMRAEVDGVKAGVVTGERGTQPGVDIVQ